MKVNVYKPSFKGHDSCELKGVLVTDKTCAQAIKKALENCQDSFNVYTPNISSSSVKKEYLDLMFKNALMWAQDYFTFLRKPYDVVLTDNSRLPLQKVLKETASGIKQNLGIKGVPTDPHLRGGNFYICEKNGQKEMLLSSGQKIYPLDFIRELYSVDKIVELPRLDYHLDLFIRPIGDGNVLVSDYSLTIQGLKDGIARINSYIKNNLLDKEEIQVFQKAVDNLQQAVVVFEKNIENDSYAPQKKLPMLINRLKFAGYNPIKVPGVYYDVQVSDDFKSTSGIGAGRGTVNIYKNNFLNAIAAKKDGKVVYITNSPLLDKSLGITSEIEKKTGFSTKNMFLESIEPYIQKENVFFIDEKITKKLFSYTGGIHCTASEIPEI